MPSAAQQQSDWVDGFLFVGNQLALDFLNTKPILNGAPRELLPTVGALGRWLIASGIVTSRKNKALVRAWRDSPEGAALIKSLLPYRERLRAALVRLESGRTPGDAFLSEVNLLLKKHPQCLRLIRQGSSVVLSECLELRKPSEVWAPIAAATAELLSEVEGGRIRKCESDACVVHFYDTSKKGARRWCSMNICGNKLKVAAYRKRRRLS